LIGSWFAVVRRGHARPACSGCNILSESTWDSEQVNGRRLELLVTDPATAPQARGVCRRAALCRAG
jgi:hypothetical protein